MLDRLRRGVLWWPVRYFAGPGLMAGAGLVPLLQAKVPMVAVGWAIIAGANYFATKQVVPVDARETLGALLQHTVDAIEGARPTPASRSLRGNIMLVDRASDSLKIEFATSGYSQPERDLRWQRGQGCCGTAWQNGATRYGPEADELPVALEAESLTTRPWNMSPEQIRATAGTVGSVLSVPIRLPAEGTNVVGVLNLDDRKGLDESLLGSEEIRDAVENLAERVGAILAQSGLIRR